MVQNENGVQSRCGKCELIKEYGNVTTKLVGLRSISVLLGGALS